MNPTLGVALLGLTVLATIGGELADQRFPVRGLCIAAPTPSGVERFERFIREELAPRRVNTLILRVDYRYAYTSRPELRESGSLTSQDVKRLVAATRQHGIRLIPQINLLGHQSWAGSLGRLLQVYPEFDETPQIRMPEKYSWPNAEGLYCKSYCPLHPKVHEVVFALVDELCDIFEAEAFHAGLDEVFYIGMDGCPRCAGKSKAELFAGEVTRIRDHLRAKGRTLWMWGDRLLDGKTTGLGEWEASLNGTDAAIDLIPKDVVICDWHYERADPTSVYFALKGFRVVTCPWKNLRSATQQVQDVVRLRDHSTPEIRDRVLGIVQTVWSGADAFLGQLAAPPSGEKGQGKASEADCFRRTFDEISAVLGVQAASSDAGK